MHTLSERDAPPLPLAIGDSLRCARPQRADQRRAAHRIDAVLKAQAHWQDSQRRRKGHTGVLTNISGGGACLFTRARPEFERLHIDVFAPDAFIEEWVLRRVERLHRTARAGTLGTDPLQTMRRALRKEFDHIECRIVESSIYKRDQRGPIHALALAFIHPHEGCFRLVSYLERQALQRGLEAPQPRVAA